MRFKNKNVALIGLGIEGKDALKFLLGEGAFITVFDQKEKSELDLTGLMIKKIKFICGKNYLDGDFSNFDYIVRSPGVYPYKPALLKAKKEGVLITSPIKIFFERCAGKIIGVTGTKGKGTTSSLIYEILRKVQKEVFLAGNIGIPYLSLLKKITKNSWVVMELSSFQLIDLRKSPHIAVVLNITKDHLDWHKDIKEYVNAKKNIVRYQNEKDFAVINSDYKVSKGFGKVAKGKVIYFSGKDVLKFYNTKKFLLLGKHNWENIAAATAVSRVLGIGRKIVQKVVYNFKGLEHRLEFVGKGRGVSFYNDSFSTNPQPSIAAVNSFNAPITIILGGYDKGLDYTELGEVISKKKNVGCVVLIGDTARKIKEALFYAKYNGKIIELGKPPTREIVKVAFKNTPKDGVVVFSPASASFDMFDDYKQRGKIFKKEVLNFLKNH